MTTLWSSWIAIRSRALRSRNRRTSEDARRIDQNPLAVLRALQEELRYNRFKFEPQMGVLKKRRQKVPRPIVVSPVTNRIVQRAILEVLQSEKPSIRRRLGEISKKLSTPTSVGGIPHRGAPDAVRLIRAAWSEGASHFVRSDIKDFYTKVPKKELLEFINDQTRDREFTDLIDAGLKVELENAADPMVKEWIDLFPVGDVGVPQGSSLSTFCANVILAEFDEVLNKRGITMIRYIDDFVILGPNQTAVQRAWASGVNILKKLGLEAHQPTPGGQKASLGEVSSGFEFLSYNFRGTHVGLSRSAKQRLLNEIDSDLRQARKSIQVSMANSRRAEPRFLQALHALAGC